MFKVTVAHDIGDFEKFTDAFKEFYWGVKNLVNSGTSLQALETTCFITYESANESLPLEWYDARDFAYKIGLLVGSGELKEIEEPPLEQVVAVFEHAATEHIDEQIRDIGKKLARIRALLENEEGV
jgi:hypothetical protein